MVRAKAKKKGRMKREKTEKKSKKTKKVEKKETNIWKKEENEDDVFGEEIGNPTEEDVDEFGDEEKGDELE